MFSSFFGKKKNDHNKATKKSNLDAEIRALAQRNNTLDQKSQDVLNKKDNKEYFDNLKNILALHDESSKISKREAKVTSGDNNIYNTASDSVEKNKGKIQNNNNDDDDGINNNVNSKNKKRKRSSSLSRSTTKTKQRNKQKTNTRKRSKSKQKKTVRKKITPLPRRSRSRSKSKTGKRKK